MRLVGPQPSSAARARAQSVGGELMGDGAGIVAEEVAGEWGSLLLPYLRRSVAAHRNPLPPPAARFMCVSVCPCVAVSLQTRLCPHRRPWQTPSSSCRRRAPIRTCTSASLTRTATGSWQVRSTPARGRIRGRQRSSDTVKQQGSEAARPSSGAPPLGFDARRGQGAAKRDLKAQRRSLRGEALVCPRPLPRAQHTQQSAPHHTDRAMWAGRRAGGWGGAPQGGGTFGRRLMGPGRVLRGLADGDWRMATTPTHSRRSFGPTGQRGACGPRRSAVCDGCNMRLQLLCMVRRVDWQIRLPSHAPHGPLPPASYYPARCAHPRTPLALNETPLGQAATAGFIANRT